MRHVLERLGRRLLQRLTGGDYSASKWGVRVVLTAALQRGREKKADMGTKTALQAAPEVASSGDFAPLGRLRIPPNYSAV